MERLYHHIDLSYGKAYTHGVQLLDYSDDSIERINVFEHFGLVSHESLLELEFSSQLIDSRHIVPMGLG